MQTSYRLFVGDNIEGIPNYIYKRLNYYQWDNYNTNDFNLWTCSFAVDGTIYDVKSILKIIRRVPYHNPINLEENVYYYVRDLKLLSNGLSPIKSCLIVTKLNRVSTCSFNPTINISTELLNNKFLEGYELKIKIPSVINNANIVPLEVILYKEQQEELIYKLDNYGQKVQNALGPEGTKYIV